MQIATLTNYRPSGLDKAVIGFCGRWANNLLSNFKAAAKSAEAEQRLVLSRKSKSVMKTGADCGERTLPRRLPEDLEPTRTPYRIYPMDRRRQCLRLSGKIFSDRLLKLLEGIA
jgi:hypothetical protein